MGKQLTEELKKQISELYRNSDMTNYEIAKALGVSSRSIRRYKNYGYQESNMQPESYDQELDDQQDIEKEKDTDFKEKSKEFEQENETVERDDNKEESCSGCGKQVSKLLTIRQAINMNLVQIKESELWAWDYYCPNCKKLISLKECPDCGADISHFIEIRKTNVPEEQKQKYDFVCSNCHELINIDDL